MTEPRMGSTLAGLQFATPFVSPGFYPELFILNPDGSGFFPLDSVLMCTVVGITNLFLVYFKPPFRVYPVKLNPFYQETSHYMEFWYGMGCLLIKSRKD